MLVTVPVTPVAKFAPEKYLEQSSRTPLARSARVAVGEGVVYVAVGRLLQMRVLEPVGRVALYPGRPLYVLTSPH